MNFFLFLGMIDCLVWCKGKYIINFEYVVCVDYNISFYINKILIIKLNDVVCFVERCIVKVIDFDCVFIVDEGNVF